jgi:hypothetical protein
MGKYFSKIFYTEVKEEKNCCVCKKTIDTFAVKEISRGQTRYWCSYQCYKNRI